MRDEDLRRTWARQAQLDAERGVIECRMCRRRSGLDETITLWRNGALVFAACDRCAGSHDVLLTPSDAGIEVRARQRRPLEIGGGT
jgi:hypothetical protein